MGKEEPELPEWLRLPSEEEIEKRSAARDRRSRQQLPALLGLAVLCVSAQIVDDISAIPLRAIIAIPDLVLICWPAMRHR